METLYSLLTIGLVLILAISCLALPYVLFKTTDKEFDYLCEIGSSMKNKKKKV